MTVADRITVTVVIVGLFVAALLNTPVLALVSCLVMLLYIIWRAV